MLGISTWVITYIPNLTRPHSALDFPPHPTYISPYLYQGIAAIHTDVYEPPLILLSLTPHLYSTLVIRNSYILPIMLLEALHFHCYQHHLSFDILSCGLMQQPPNQIPCFTLASHIQWSAGLNLVIYWFTWKHTHTLLVLGRTPRNSNLIDLGVWPGCEGFKWFSQVIVMCNQNWESLLHYTCSTESQILHT